MVYIDLLVLYNSNHRGVGGGMLLRFVSWSQQTVRQSSCWGKGVTSQAQIKHLMAVLCNSCKLRRSSPKMHMYGYASFCYFHDGGVNWYHNCILLEVVSGSFVWIRLSWFRSRLPPQAPNNNVKFSHQLFLQYEQSFWD